MTSSSDAIVDVVRAFMRDTAPALLGVPREVIDANLEKDTTKKMLTQLVGSNDATDVSNKVITLRLAAGGGNDDVSFALGVEALATTTANNDADSGEECRNIIAYVKKRAVLDAKAPMASQLYVVQLDSSAPFHTIMSCVRHCFLPYSRSMMLSDELTQGGGGGGGDDMNSVKLVSARLMELDVELRRLQRVVEIPRVVLEVHPVVRKYVASCVALGVGVEADGLPYGADTVFLNEIQKLSNTWKRQILSVTQMEWDISAGTTMDEVQFWTSLSRCIEDIQRQLATPEIKLTFELMKLSRRFAATTYFSADSGLELAEKRVDTYLTFLRDLPIDELLSAADVAGVTTAVTHLFTQFRNIRRIEYPPQRALALVHAVSRDVTEQLHAVLTSSRALMGMGKDDFNKAVRPADKLHREWENQLDDFAQMITSLRRKLVSSGAVVNDGDFDLYKPHVDLERFFDRLREVHNLRKAHFDLEDAAKQTLSADVVVREASLKHIDEAYGAHLQAVDVLDTGEVGTEAWRRAVTGYHASIDEVEKELEDRIRALLAAAKHDSNEMFRVCAKFNALFVRPRIQGAIREYQDQLIGSVKEDIRRLQEKFKRQFKNSEARRMSELMDVPPVSGAIIWGQQIERQLDQYLQRVEDVLGNKWSRHPEGKRLKLETDQFKRKLDPKPLFDEWLSSMRDFEYFEVEDTIFDIVSTPIGGELLVNFSPQTVVLFKEVRNLTRLELRVPYQIKIAASEAREKYPFAVRLREAIQVYTWACSRLDEHPALTPLLAAFKLRVQRRVERGMEERISWDNYMLQEYVNKLTNEAIDLQDQVEDLLYAYAKMESDLKVLETCDMSRATLGGIVERVQSTIDLFDNLGYSNLTAFTQHVDTVVEDVLVDRTVAVLRKVSSMLSTTTTTHVSTLTHTVRVQQGVIVVEPPIAHAYLSMVDTLAHTLSRMLDIPRVECDSYDRVTFRDAVMSRVGDELSAALSVISTNVRHARKYVEGVAHSALGLWALDVGTVERAMADDYSQWTALISEIRAQRNVFASWPAQRQFGTIKVDCAPLLQAAIEQSDHWVHSATHAHRRQSKAALAALCADVAACRARVDAASEAVASASVPTTTAMSLLHAAHAQRYEWRRLLAERQVEGDEATRDTAARALGELREAELMLAGRIQAQEVEQQQRAASITAQHHQQQQQQQQQQSGMSRTDSVADESRALMEILDPDDTGVVESDALVDALWSYNDSMEDEFVRDLIAEADPEGRGKIQHAQLVPLMRKVMSPSSAGLNYDGDGDGDDVKDDGDDGGDDGGGGMSTALRRQLSGVTGGELSPFANVESVAAQLNERLQAMLKSGRDDQLRMMEKEFRAAIERAGDGLSYSQLTSLGDAVSVHGSAPNPEHERMTRDLADVIERAKHQISAVHQDHDQRLHTRLQAQQAEVLQSLEVARRLNDQATEHLDTRMREVLSHQHQTSTLVRQLDEKPCPSIAMMLPCERRHRMNAARAFTKQYRLYLFCECPGAIHVAQCDGQESGYVINAPKPLVTKLAPLFAVIWELVAAGLSLPDGMGKHIVKSARQPFDHDSVLKQEFERCVSEIKDHATLVNARGAALRELQYMLDNKLDKKRQYQGLHKTPLADGTVVWVCSFHRDALLSGKTTINFGGDGGGGGVQPVPSSPPPPPPTSCCVVS